MKQWIGDPNFYIDLGDGVTQFLQYVCNLSSTVIKGMQTLTRQNMNSSNIPNDGTQSKYIDSTFEKISHTLHKTAPLTNIQQSTDFQEDARAQSYNFFHESYDPVYA
jgi:hypothetical protein